MRWLPWLSVLAVALAAAVGAGLLLAAADWRGVPLAPLAFFAGVMSLDFRPWRRLP